MVVGAFFVSLTAHFIGNAVVEHIADDVKVKPANRTGDKSLCFSAAETGTLRTDKKALTASAPFSDVIIDLRGKALAALHPDDTEFSV